MRDAQETVEEIESTLPEEALASSDIAVLHPEEILVESEAAFGGMRIQDGAFGGNCTTSWVIAERYGPRRGIAAAAHCTGMDEVVHINHGTHPTYQQEDHEGDYGDIEWHNTNADKPANFFAAGGDQRPVEATELVFSRYESVCGYGRTSNNPACSSVDTPVAQCEGEGGVDLLLTRSFIDDDDDLLVKGDSGGPWYWGNTAYGTHFGNCDDREAFTGVGNFYPAFGFDVAIHQ